MAPFGGNNRVRGGRQVFEGMGEWTKLSRHQTLCLNPPGQPRSLPLMLSSLGKPQTSGIAVREQTRRCMEH